jgi:tryptophan-rich sensory protein
MLTKLKPITLKQILLGILGFVLANIVAGYGIIALGVDVPQIYAGLSKPYFAPPTAIFGVVWTFNTVLFIYGFLRLWNLPDSSLRTKLLRVDYLIIFNYLVFQYLSFGSGLLFGAIIPALFAIPTITMLILVIVAMKLSYTLDTAQIDLLTKIKTGQSIFMTYTPLVSWLVIASALGLGIWFMN